MRHHGAASRFRRRWSAVRQVHPEGLRSGQRSPRKNSQVPVSTILRVQSVQLDPLEPPRFKHKRIPKGPGSPPPIMMRSPPRKLTVKDQLDWKIPPCISNWKNAKGYTIPLEMRLSADGRTLQHVSNISRLAHCQRKIRPID